MRALWLLCIITLFSCKSNIENWKIDYPPEVATEVEQFILNAPEDLRVKPLTIRLVDKVDSDIDAAGKSDIRKREIQLDTTSTHYKTARFALVWHELGHYVLDRPHNDETQTFLLNNGNMPILPVTLMSTYSFVITDESLKQHYNIRQHYMSEMFSN